MKICILLSYFLLICEYTSGEPDPKPEPALKFSQVLITNPCKAGLGDVCTNNWECCPAKSICLDGMCQCKNPYKRQSEKCAQPAVNIGGSCTNDGQCIGAFTKCQRGVCGCTENSVQENGMCKQVCSTCSEKNECTLPNTQCDRLLCQCLPNFTLVKGYCQQRVPDPGTLGGSCLISSDCSTANSSCSEAQCKCQPLHAQVFNTCLEERNHGQNCENHIQCPVNEFCNCDGRCVCKTGFIYEEGLTKCEAKRDFGEECQVTIQCNYNNSQCVEGSCRCQEGHGLSKTIVDCVPISESTLLDLTMNITYNENFNNESSAEYAVIQPTIDLLVTRITDRLVAEGVDVIGISVDALRASSNGTILDLIVEAYNSELDRSSISRSKRNKEQPLDSRPIDVAQFIKNIEEELRN